MATVYGVVRGHRYRVTPSMKNKPTRQQVQPQGVYLRVGDTLYGRENHPPPLSTHTHTHTNPTHGGIYASMLTLGALGWCCTDLG